MLTTVGSLSGPAGALTRRSRPGARAREVHTLAGLVTQEAQDPQKRAFQGCEKFAHDILYDLFSEVISPYADLSSNWLSESRTQISKPLGSDLKSVHCTVADRPKQTTGPAPKQPCQGLEEREVPDEE